MSTVDDADLPLLDKEPEFDRFAARTKASTALSIGPVLTMKEW